MASLATWQGVYYAATGLWPLVSRRTFEAVTGPKTDWWLVQTVGVLVGAIGGTLLLAGRRGAERPEVAFLGAASAAGLAAIDVVHAARGRISPVYLLDAAAEAALVAAWTAGSRLAGRAGEGAPCEPRRPPAGRSDRYAARPPRPPV
ncbi:MAG TPA: hypothetical protein VF406_04150 [Thermodesulfobacteriota bacterium]